MKLAIAACMAAISFAGPALAEDTAKKKAPIMADATACEELPAAKAKELDCGSTGTIGNNRPTDAAVSNAGKPRLGYVESPWFFSGN